MTFEKEKITEYDRYILRKRYFQNGNKRPFLKWYPLRYHKRPTAPATLFDIVIGFIFSLFIVLKNRIDLIHSRAVVSAIIGYPVSRLLGRKFIFDMRGIDSEEYVDACLWSRKSFRYKVVSAVENMLVRNSDWVVVLTHRFRYILQNRFKDEKIRFSVIPCAVDVSKFQIRTGKPRYIIKRLELEKRFIITYTGSIGTWYMFHEMLDLFRVASGVIKNAHFLVLTPQRKDEYLAEEIERSGINPSLVTLDYVSHDMVPEYLSICDMGLCFIKPVFSKLSSSPVKFAEYLSVGLPVIINAGIGDTDELVKRYRVGAVIDKFDEESYYKAFRTVIDMIDKEGAVLRQRCRELVEKELALNNAVDKYFYIYRNIDNTI